MIHSGEVRLVSVAMSEHNVVRIVTTGVTRALVALCKSKMLPRVATKGGWCGTLWYIAQFSLWDAVLRCGYIVRYTGSVMMVRCRHTVLDTGSGVQMS